MIPGVKRVCLGCGTLTATGSRCPACKTKQDRAIEARRGERPHYQGDYKKRAARVRARADADPTTLCWRCGQPKGAGRWTAGHVIAGDPNSELLPEHAKCNYGAGKRNG